MKRVRNQWPLLRVVLRYHGIVTKSCLCVTDLRRDTTLSKGTLNFTQNACIALFHYVHGTFLLPSPPPDSVVRICAEKGAAYNDERSNWFINNDAFSHPHVRTKFSRPNGYLKTNVTVKYISVIRARLRRANSLSLSLSQLYIIHMCHYRVCAL